MQKTTFNIWIIPDLEKIAVRVKSRTTLINLKEIVYLKSIRDFIDVMTVSLFLKGFPGTQARCTMSMMELYLEEFADFTRKRSAGDPEPFIKVRRGLLINKNMITSMNEHGNQTGEVFQTVQDAINLKSREIGHNISNGQYPSVFKILDTESKSLESVL